MRVGLSLALLVPLLVAGLCSMGICEEAAPELPVAEWADRSVSLEDFKGQLTVICFYDDSSS